LSRNPDPELFVRAEARVVTFDRPGYGGSTAQRDRNILSVADDALALADRLGWNTFSVLGVSGGGPHALAITVRAPERIERAGVAVGMTPPELVDEDDLIAFNREARRRFHEGGRPALESFLAEPAARMTADPVGTLVAALEDAPPVDRAMLEQPEVRAVIADSFREAFRTGPFGWFDDAWSLMNPWGFRLEDVRTPLHLWYGESDRNVPLAAAQAMAARLRVESFEVIPGAGHAGWLVQEERVLRTLLDS
jgi:pimeloyl-ACP methyl ester carboxylesterase